MATLAPLFAALLKQTAEPLAPTPQDDEVLGAGTGLVAPPRLKYSPKLAALIDTRRKALAPAEPNNLSGDARG